MALHSTCLQWHRVVATITLLMAASLAQAQATPTRTERANPLDAQARVPAVTYQSPLARYRRLGDDERVSWKEANEAVTRIGGWRTYLRQAQQPEPAASAPAALNAPAAAPASAPAHGGHTRH